MNESRPFFSIITIVKNGVEFIDQTIESVLRQSYKNYEYIIIDGGSTDGTLDIIRSHDGDLSKWISEKDDGIASAFNKGFGLTQGQYILFLNSDDQLADSSVLETIFKRIEENGYPELIYGDYDILNRESGELEYRGRVVLDRTKIRYGQVLPHPCLFTNRCYFEKYGLFDAEFRIAMDYEWLLRGILDVKVVHLPFLTTQIRSGGLSTLSRQSVVNEIIRGLKKNGYFATKWSEYSTKAYFIGRALSKRTLMYLGLYRKAEISKK